ncbi:MAG: hypothetical protein M1831_003861 [Alyxoria varia]|nr:MAG: hypothetical protein M1831_003861 [Alyxoria varia]
MASDDDGAPQTFPEHASSEVDEHEASSEESEVESASGTEAGNGQSNKNGDDDEEAKEANTEETSRWFKILRDARGKQEAQDPSKILIIIEANSTSLFLDASNFQTSTAVHDRSFKPNDMTTKAFVLEGDELNDQYLLECYSEWANRHTNGVGDTWFQRTLWEGRPKPPRKTKQRWTHLPSLWYLAWRLQDNDFMDSVVRETVKMGNATNRTHVTWEFLEPMSRVVPGKLGDRTTEIKGQKLVRAMVEVFCKRTNREDFKKAVEKGHGAVQALLLERVEPFIHLAFPDAQAKVKVDDYV